MKTWSIFFSIVMIFLAGCSIAPDHAQLPPDCNTPGTVQPAEAADFARGFPYRFVVYLPPCYDETAEPGYPVIYLVPGRGGRAANWFDVGINEIADQVILAGEAPPFILVSTESTNTDPQADEIYRELIPYIEANFNIIGDRVHRVAAGGSLGGIAAYRLAFRYPDEFASAGLFGSGVINGENEQVMAWLSATTDANRPRAFINVGEQDPLMLEQAYVMVDILEQTGVSYEFVVGEGAHTYDYWASNMAQYFRWAAQDW